MFADSNNNVIEKAHHWADYLLIYESFGVVIFRKHVLKLVKQHAIQMVPGSRERPMVELLMLDLEMPELGMPELEKQLVLAMHEPLERVTYGLVESFQRLRWNR